MSQKKNMEPTTWHITVWNEDGSEVDKNIYVSMRDKTLEQIQKEYIGEQYDISQARYILKKGYTDMEHGHYWYYEKNEWVQAN